MFITLTELRYVVALAQEKHFGRAANKCFVSQPTLSIAIKKLEDNLGLQIFERSKTSLMPTDAGLEIISQAQHVLESVAKIEEFAKHGNDPFSTPLKLGAIHTVGPYLYPDLIANISESRLPLKLMLEEDMTANLSEKLIQGELDAIIVAKPFERPNISSIDLYSEELEVILPANHILKTAKQIKPEELENETLLLLGSGHCFRDQVLKICPSYNFAKSDGNKHSIITSSIETIKYMVAGNIGISIVPRRSLNGINPELILNKPFIAPTPKRDIILAYRSGFSRIKVLEALIQIIQQITSN
jgi:LysR family hydrogen peroxide-inducible transcriptional activator